MAFLSSAVLDLPEVIERVAHHQPIGLSSRQRLAAAVTAARIGAVGSPPRPPAEETRRRHGRLHSVSRDAQSVSHHYDVRSEFYRLILGLSMVYSCAYWAQEPGPDYSLDQAQRDKCELVCAKLGLRPRMRLLMPFTKFAHAMYRPVALFFYALAADRSKQSA